MCPLVPFSYGLLLFSYVFSSWFFLICVVVAGFFLAVVNGLLSLCSFQFLRGWEVKDPLRLIEEGES